MWGRIWGADTRRTHPSPGAPPLRLTLDLLLTPPFPPQTLPLSWGSHLAFGVHIGNREAASGFLFPHYTKQEVRM